jgi:hypothetical protein
MMGGQQAAWGAPLVLHTHTHSTHNGPFTLVLIHLRNILVLGCDTLAHEAVAGAHTVALPHPTARQHTKSSAPQRRAPFQAHQRTQTLLPSLQARAVLDT